MRVLAQLKRAGLLWLLLLALALVTADCSSVGTLTAPQSKHPTTTTTFTSHLPAGPLTYVALGASDAVGVGSNQPGSQGYVPLIGDHLPKGSHVVNLGISGIRLHEALSAELPVALSTSPDLVTIWLVVNDFVGGVPYDSYMQDAATLLQQLQAGTRASIVMANLPDLTLLPAFSNQSPAQKTSMRQAIQQWNTGIAAVAARYHVTLVDLFHHDQGLTSHPEYISGDGFHPSPAGYVQLASIFWQAIQGQAG